METVVFNAKSWHYKLACKVGFKYWRDDLDLCNYIRWVVWGMVVAIGAVSLALLATYAVGDALAWWVAMLFNWAFIEAHVAGGVATIIGGVAGFVFCGVVFSIRVWPRLEEWWTGVEVNVAPSFVAEAYRSLKSKTCRRVSFK